MKNFFRLAACCAVALVIGLMASMVNGQCPGRNCPTQQWSMPNVIAQPTATKQTGIYKSAVRVWNQKNNRERFGGSGCWVNYGGYQWIVTCYHTFRPSVGKIWITNSDGTTANAQMAVHDEEYDVAILWAEPPAAEIPRAELADELPASNQTMTACGYGAPNAGFRSVRGRFTKFVMPNTQASAADWLEMTGAARQGDSGGPIYDEQGKLCGILFGTNGHVINGVHVGRLKIMLELAIRTLRLTRRTAVRVVAGGVRVAVVPRTVVVAPMPVVVVPAPTTIVKEKTVKRYRRLAYDECGGWLPSRDNAYQPAPATQQPSPAMPGPEPYAPMVPVPDPNMGGCAPNGCGPNGCNRPTPAPMVDVRIGEKDPILKWRKEQESKDRTQDSAIRGLQQRPATIEREIQVEVQPVPAPKHEAKQDDGIQPIGVGACIFGALVVGVLLFYVAGKN